MPIKRSSIKDVRRTKRRRPRNIAVISRLRNQITKARAASEPEIAAKELKATERLLDKAARRGYIKAKTAARTKSRLASRVYKLSKA